MTWHVRGKLKELTCFHVDDVMISGPKMILSSNV